MSFFSIPNALISLLFVGRLSDISVFTTGDGLGGSCSVARTVATRRCVVSFQTSLLCFSRNYGSVIDKSYVTCTSRSKYKAQTSGCLAIANFKFLLHLSYHNSAIPIRPVSLMSEGLSRDLSHMLVLSLPLLGEFDAKASAENLPNGLERHALTLGVAEDNKEPAKRANATVEPKGAARRHSFHHGQEGRGDDDIRAPAGDSVLGIVSIELQTGPYLTHQHCSDSSNL